MSDKTDKIKPLNKQVEQQIKQAEERKKAWTRHAHSVRHKRRLRTIIIFGVFIVILLIQLIMSQVTLHQKEHDLQATQNQLTRVKEKQADLKEQAKKLNNPDYLKQILREKYGYSKNNETIFNLPKD